jgi:hypothetical protein
MARTKASAQQSSLRELAERMHELFAGFQGAHGTHGEPVQDEDSPKWIIKPTAQTLHEPPSRDLWERHLTGTRPLGIVPIDENDNCIWGSIDIDVYPVNAQEIASRIENNKLPLVPVVSKSGGLHLFLFTRGPHLAAEFISILNWLAASLGYAKSEIYPKQTKVLDERGDRGSWMVMPYYAALGGDPTFGGKIKAQTGITAGGGILDLEGWLDVADEMRLTNAKFEDLLKKRGRTRATAAPKHNGRATNGHANHDIAVEEFEDGPPCLQTLADEGFPAGQHNNALIPIGVYLKKVAADTGGDWKQQLIDANVNFGLKQTVEQVMSATNQLTKHDYYYPCKKEPICSFCDSKECRKRRYGVGDGNQLPTITGLVMLDTKPDPIWFLDVDGFRVTLTNEQFFNYGSFCLVMQRHGKAYDPMKPYEWAKERRGAMSSMDIVEPPPDEEYQVFPLKDMIREWVTSWVSIGKEGMLSGKPWLDSDGQTMPDGLARYFFKLSDLLAHLLKQGVKDITNQGLGRIIKDDYGGGDHTFGIKVGEREHRTCRARWILKSKFETAELPAIKEPRPVL